VTVLVCEKGLLWRPFLVAKLAPNIYDDQMKAAILAAGEGSRLRPLTLDTPKPLIVVAGKPIIDHIIAALPEEVDEVVMVVGHLQDKIRDHLGEKFGGRKIVYIEQGEKKGTLGALWSVKEYLNKGEKFLVLNGDDIHTKEGLQKFLEYPRAFGVQKMIMPNYYSVQTTEDGYLAGFKKQTEEEKVSGTLVATGAYVLDHHIFDHAGVVVSGGEYGLPQTIDAQRLEFPINIIETTDWMPVNSLEELEKANSKNI